MLQNVIESKNGIPIWAHYDCQYECKTTTTTTTLLTQRGLCLES